MCFAIQRVLLLWNFVVLLYFLFSIKLLNLILYNRNPNLDPFTFSQNLLCQQSLLFEWNGVHSRVFIALWVCRSLWRILDLLSASDFYLQQQTNIWGKTNWCYFIFHVCIICIHAGSVSKGWLLLSWCCELYQCQPPKLTSWLIYQCKWSHSKGHDAQYAGPSASVRNCFPN